MPRNAHQNRDGDRKSLGQWGPRGPHSTSAVQASMRALFHSRWLMWAARLLLLTALALITWQSLAPIGQPSSIPNIDKVMHFIAYAGVAALAVFSFQGRIWLALGLALLWGAGIELGQGVMALGREASLADMIANGAGAAFGTVLAAWLRRY